MKKAHKKVITAICALSAVTCVSVGIASAVIKKGPFVGTVSDSNGVPVKNVSVTDGRNVVKTDENGSFILKGWRKTDFITVTVPSGYATDEFYIPVSKNAESYDFTLTKSEKTSSAEHCFLQISDTEIGAGGTGEWLDAIKSIIKEKNPAFLMHTGDICYEDGLKRHIQDMNTDTMGCTVRYTIGNHDYVNGKFGEELYESIYGPVWYSFEVGNIHYTVTSFQNGSDYKSKYDKNDRWRWLKNDLENTDKNKKVIMFNHTKAPSDDFILSIDREKIDLKEYNLAAWIFGHYHYNYIDETNGVLNISTARPDSGGIDSSPAGTRLVNISADGSIKTEMIYYGSESFSAPENALWVTELNGNGLYCDTLGEDGDIFTATIDDDYPRKCGVCRIDGKSGEIKWFTATDNSIKNNIITDGKLIFAQDTEGTVYFIDKADGTVQKKIETGLNSDLGTSCGSAIHNNTLITGNARKITAINTDNGEIIWQTKRTSGENSPAEFIYADNKVIVSSHWDALAALDINTGKELWKNKDSDIRFRSSTPAMLENGNILVADSGAIMTVNPEDGEILTKKSPDGYNFSSSGQPAVSGNIAYIPTARNGLIAYDAEKDEIIWEFLPEEANVFTSPYVGKGAAIIEASPLIAGDTIIQPANDGKIYILNKDNGSVVKSFNAGSAILGKAFTDNEKIWAVTFDSKAVCFEWN